jgi:hypothetical protein
VAGPLLPVAGGVAEGSPPAPVPDCGFGLVGVPLIPVVPPCPAPFVVPPFWPWVAAGGAMVSEPRGVGVVCAEAMPLETSRPAAANSAKCFLICICFPLNSSPEVSTILERARSPLFFKLSMEQKKKPRGEAGQSQDTT